MTKASHLPALLLLLLLLQASAPIAATPVDDGPAQEGPGAGALPMDAGGRFSYLGGDDEPVQFTMVSTEANLSQHGGSYFAWGDYDADGRVDLMVNGRRLLRNDGPPGWTFTDVTEYSGLGGRSGVNVGVWGDYDNDGDLDVYLAGGGWTTSTPTRSDYLLRNDGDGTFTDVTAAAGNVVDDYPSTAAAWGDIDGDGHLDLYVANYETEAYEGWPDTLWHNDGDGTFTEVSASSGIRSAGSEPGRGVAFCDYDDDGDMDIHVSNYRIRPNFLWANDGTGHFTNVAAQAGVTGDALYYQSYGPYYGHTIGSSWADWNNDGLMDIWEANLVHKYVGGSDIRGYICDDSKFYRNNGPPAWDFTDVRPQTGIPYKPVGGSGTYRGDELYDGIAWADFDNDGDLDVFMPQVYNLDYAYSYLYMNRGDGTFVDVGPNYGVRVWNTYGAAWADYDNDGDLDLVTGGKAPLSAGAQVHLYRNSGNTNRWLKVRVEGTSWNRDALGARVTVVVGNTTMTRDVEGGTGSHAQMNDMPLEFGLGKADRADTVIVRFPGTTMVFVDVDANTTLEVQEADHTPPDLGPGPWPSTLLEDQALNLTTTATAVTSGTYTGYYWDTDGDWVFDRRTTHPKVTVTYPTAGDRVVRVGVATDVGGQGFLAISGDGPIAVENRAPMAVAGGDLTVMEDHTFELNGSASSDTPSDLETLEYRWVVDGEDLGWSQNPSTVVGWTKVGTHRAELWVRDDDGATDVDVANITVENPPPVVNHPGDIEAFEDRQVTISTWADDTPSDIGSLAYRIFFGDGVSTEWGDETSWTHVYRTAGELVVRVDARDDDGAVGTVRFNLTVLNEAPRCVLSVGATEVEEDEEFTVSGTVEDTLSDADSLEWRYDFGDGNGTDWRRRPVRSETHNYVRAGRYTITLLVRDDDDDQNSSSVSMEVVNRLPLVSLFGPTSSVEEDEEVELEAEALDTPFDQTRLMYRWDLGDGTVLDWSPAITIHHSYATGGTYYAEVTVRDDDGAEARARTPVSVINRPPVARVTQSADTVEEDTEVTFNASSSYDTPGDMGSLEFDWISGGELRSGTTVTFSWPASGVHNVVLRITDDDGAVTEEFYQVTVTNRVPSGTTVADRLEARVGETFTFSAHGLDDTPSDLEQLSLTWAFGDGGVAAGTPATHSYNGAGDYTVVLTIRDDDGAQAEWVLYVTVTEEAGMFSGTGGVALVAGLVALALLALVVVMVRWRGRLGREGASADGDGDEGPDGPPADAVTDEQGIPKYEKSE